MVQKSSWKYWKPCYLSQWQCDTEQLQGWPILLIKELHSQKINILKQSHISSTTTNSFIQKYKIQSSSCIPFILRLLNNSTETVVDDGHAESVVSWIKLKGQRMCETKALFTQGCAMGLAVFYMLDEQNWNNMTITSICPSLLRGRWLQLLFIRVSSSWIMNCLQNIFLFLSCSLSQLLTVASCFQFPSCSSHTNHVDTTSRLGLVVPPCWHTPFIQAVDLALLLPLLPSQRQDNFDPLIMWCLYRRVQRLCQGPKSVCILLNITWHSQLSTTTKVLLMQRHCWKSSLDKQFRINRQHLD